MSSITQNSTARRFRPAKFASVLGRVVLRVLKWPAKVMQARQDMALLANMSAHELRDIGLSRADIANATALALDDDPTLFLAGVASDRHRYGSRLGGRQI